jgi:hypothetical protein
MGAPEGACEKREQEIKVQQAAEAAQVHDR